MSDLLNKASLVVIPSGYKEDTVYSVVPTDGSGDLSFTRASNGTRINSAGLVEVCPWNDLQQSETFNNAVWTVFDISITADSTTAPNGTTTADKAVLSVANIAHFMLQDSSITSGIVYTQSFYVKASGYSFVQITGSTGFTTNYANFNLSDGTLGTTDGGTATITSVGNGWYRLTYTLTAASTTTGRFLLAVVPSASSTRLQAFAGNGTDGVYLWGAQLNIGSTAKPYFPTTDRLNVPRLTYQNGGGGCPALLLEPQRTNVVLYSGDLSQSVWVKPNYALSNVAEIQGLTATRITKNSTNNGTWNGTGARVVINNVGTFASGTKAFSVLLRKGNTAKVGLLINQILVGVLTNVVCEFDFSTETFTNVSSGLTPTFEKITTDVYQIVLVCNDLGIATNKALWIAPINSSNNTVTDGYVDVAYFQWELGAYPTTYIPTTTASATRVADSFSRNNIYTNGLITASGGTWFVELLNNVALSRDNSNVSLYLGDNLTPTNGNGLYLVNGGGTDRLTIWKRVSGSGGFLYTTITSTVKMAIKWNGSTADVFVNGTKVVSASSFTTTLMEYLYCASGGPCQTEFISQMDLFPTPLTDAECIALTTI